MAKRRKRKG